MSVTNGHTLQIACLPPVDWKAEIVCHEPDWSSCWQDYGCAAVKSFNDNGVLDSFGGGERTPLNDGMQIDVFFEDGWWLWRALKAGIPVVDAQTGERK